MNNSIRKNDIINRLRGNLLESIATFKYLVPSQMMKLNVGTTQVDYLRKNLRWLRERNKPYADCLVYGSPDPRKGSVENLWYLTEEGRKVCVESLYMNESLIKMPIGKPPAFMDYFHRRNTVDFHIQLHLWAKKSGWDITLFDTYFDKVGSNRNSSKNGSLRAKNRIALSDGDYLIPDANTIIQNEKGRRELFLLEIHRTDKHTKKLIGQIVQHCQAQYLGSPQIMYKLEQPYYVVIIFEFESVKQATIRRIANHPNLVTMRDYFLCKSLDELENKPFFEGWQTLSGKTVDFLS